MSKDQQIIHVEELPEGAKRGALFSIDSNNINSFTHGIHKYPAKFIPQIPRWGIKEFTRPGDIVLDPFCGCGTTLVESLLSGRNAYGLEISPLAKLITKTKITKIKPAPLEKEHLRLLNKLKKRVWSPFYWKPFIEPNLLKWFKPQSVKGLSIIKKNIEGIKDKNIKDFYTIIFSSIIRRVSNAENQSQKVYISSRFPKEYIDPIKLFSKVAEKEKNGLVRFSNAVSGKNRAKIIKKDALKINLESQSVDFAITSPPYINAINYIRVQRLEYAWLNRFNPEELKMLEVNQMGSDKITADIWKQNLETGVKSIDRIAQKIRENSGRHSYIFSKFYLDFEKNLKEVYRVLKKNKRYCIVIGNNVIKGVFIPNDLLIRDMGERIGFKLENAFSYVIKNRLLRIPRQGRGGDINIDNVIVLRK